MATHLFIGTSGMDFPGDGTFAGFHCEPGDIVEADDNFAAFAAAQPDTAARCFDGTPANPADPPTQE
jgi:hypothetical protein